MKTFSNLAILILLPVHLVLADEFYVSATRGDNLNGNGSKEYPWKTLSFSLARIQGEGHVVNVEAGTYSSDMDTLNVTNNEIFPIFLREGITIRGTSTDSVEILGDPDKFIFTAISVSDTNASVQHINLKGGFQAFNFKNSSFRIKDCDISGQTDCAIFALDNHLDATSFLIVENNSIHNNKKGGIRLANVNAVIRNNRLENNREFAIAAYENDSIPSNVRIVDNTVNANKIAAGFGAIYCQRGAPVISRNRIANNSLSDTGSQAAGALYCDFQTQAQFINNILTGNELAIYIDGSSPAIVGNVIASGSGNAIFLDSVKGEARPLILNNTIVHNHGDGIFIQSRADGIINNIIAFNSGFGIAESQNDAAFDPDSVRNNLFYANEKGVYLDEGIRNIPDVAVLDLLVSECRSNLQGDPQFSDTLFHIQPLSPCVDAGFWDSTLVVLPATDYTGSTRIADGNGDGLPVVDIGAFELPEAAARFAPRIVKINNFSFANTSTYIINLDTCVVDEDDSVETLRWTITSEEDSLAIQIINRVAIFSAPGWTGTASVRFVVTDPVGLSDTLSVQVTVKSATNVQETGSIPQKFSLEQNYPNPFNPTTTIRFTLPQATHVRISIFNARGEWVETLVNERLSPGEYKRMWNANGVGSGVYFFKMETEGFVEIIKGLLIR